MKKIFSLMLLCTAIILIGCSKDDDNSTIPVEKVTLNKTALPMMVGDMEILTATVSPAGVENKSVMWTSNKEDVATVDDKGMVSAKAEGTAIITATSVADKTKMVTCTVTVVKEVIAVTEVKLNKTETAIEVGRTEALTATVLPDDATDKSVIWSTSDATIATVIDGMVTAVKVGTATITATSATDPNKKATCVVTVNNGGIAVTGVTLNITEKSIAISETVQLVATIAPANAVNQNVAWSSNKPEVAAVDNNGMVVGKAAGETIITVTTEDGSKMATCVVTVTKILSIEWAAGNLVATGANSAKIGEPTDAGLFFQFGSLIGWSSTGDPTIAVKPVDYVATDWNSDWKGNPDTENATAGMGDPCKYYLKGNWRLPTKNELEALFVDNGYPAGPWTWTGSSIAHTSGAEFPASGYRDKSGMLDGVGSYGHCWTTTPYDEGFGYVLFFNNSEMIMADFYDNRALGFPVRCVRLGE